MERGAHSAGLDPDYAFLDDQSIVDNPYEFDTSKHLAWENGWFEARDPYSSAK